MSVSTELRSIERRRTGGVEHDVEAVGALREILARVVEHLVRPESAHEIDVGGAADTDDVGAEVLRDLHGEVPYASRRTGNEDPLAGRKPSVVRERLQRRPTRDRQRRGLCEAHALRHGREPFDPGDKVFGQRAVTSEGEQGAEHPLADVMRGRAAADPGDHTREVASDPARRPSKYRCPAHVAGAVLPIERIETRRMDPHFKFACTRRWLVNLRDMENVGRTVLVETQSPHRSGQCTSSACCFSASSGITASVSSWVAARTTGGATPASNA